MRLKASTSRVSRFRWMAITMASPTAASAAATTITKKTRTCPSKVPKAWLKATNARFTAFSMSSMHMKTVMTLRRRKTPRAPIANSPRLRRTAWFKKGGPEGISGILLGQGHRPHQPGQDQDRGGLEDVEEAGGEEDLSHLAGGGVELGGGRPVPVQEDGAHLEDQERGQGEGGARERAPAPLLLGLALDVQQHQHEQEKNHDGPGVDHHLQHGDEGGAQQAVDRGETAESGDEGKGAVEGVPLAHHDQGGAQGRGREHIKKDGVDHDPKTVTMTAATIMLRTARGISTFQPKCMSWS